MRRFKGFSTVNKEFGNFKLYDVDLAKRDLLNELYTKKGERLMSPTYGSIVWDLLFDPLYESTVELIRDDCIRIVSKDPRLKLLDVTVDENIDTQTIIVKLVLEYIPETTVTELIATFERESAAERLEG